MFERILGSIRPAAGAEVMGTGIVSIALSLHGFETLSRMLLVITVLLCVWLAALLPARAARDRAGFRSDVCTPASLTCVAGTAVIGARLTMLGWTWAGAALLAIAAASWITLLVPVLTNWATPTLGTALMLTVATESLAVLAATLAVADHVGWLLSAALCPFALGLGFYVFVMARFDLRQLATRHGDHWITGGALALSTLAAGKLAIGARGAGDDRERRWGAEGAHGRAVAVDDGVAAGVAVRRGPVSAASL